MGRVELFKLLPLHSEGLPTLQTPAWKPMNQFYSTDTNIGTKTTKPPRPIWSSRLWIIFLDALR